MGKKAIITGGSRGIGKGIALALAAEGYDVAITYASKKEAAEAVAEEIRKKYGREAYCFQASLEIPGRGHEVFMQAVEALGGLDLMVNNAGLTICESIQNITEEKLDHLLNLDFRTFVLMMRDASRYMIDHGIRGSIINITSVSGVAGNPGQANYSASKAGLIGLTKSVAKELASRNITANAIAPGFVKTEMTDVLSDEVKEAAMKQIPLARFAEPEDIANAAVFLASDMASYITGQVLLVDGGMVM